jgi:hypothetical protein
MEIYEIITLICSLMMYLITYLFVKYYDEIKNILIYIKENRMKILKYLCCIIDDNDDKKIDLEMKLIDKKMKLNNSNILLSDNNRENEILINNSKILINNNNRENEILIINSNILLSDNNRENEILIINKKIEYQQLLLLNK